MRKTVQVLRTEVLLEGMSPEEYGNGGESLSIRYGFADSLFGEVFAASTAKGICRLAYSQDREGALQGLKDMFPNAAYGQDPGLARQSVSRIFGNGRADGSGAVTLHVKGTPFQLKVWAALLEIPMGQVSTYGAIAERVRKPKACRAVGTAVGSNPVAFLIPCHRVIRSGGAIGDYRWGSVRKAAMLEWEATRICCEKKRK
jgi:AraC family transcriptional regulator of adaptative response/methylated-DNA-[protein]-cysteine methyltransferase